MTYLKAVYLGRPKNLAVAGYQLAEAYNSLGFATLNFLNCFPVTAVNFRALACDGIDVFVASTVAIFACRDVPQTVQSLGVVPHAFRTSLNRKRR